MITRSWAFRVLRYRARLNSTLRLQNIYSHKSRLLRRKTAYLLIEVFRKLFNPQNDGHQGSILDGLFLYVRVSKDFAFRSIWNV